MKEAIKRAPETAEVIVSALRAIKDIDVGPIDEHEDVFLKFGLDSLKTFGVLVELENTFGIVIGEEETEFDEIRTFGGLQRLIARKSGGATPTSRVAE